MDPAEHRDRTISRRPTGIISATVIGDMVGLDRARKGVKIGADLRRGGTARSPPRRSVPYDILVIAIGSMTNDFGTPGVAEHAIPLETAEQAERFHRRLLNACLRAQAQAEPMHAGQLHIAIIGAGATGIELAAELHETTRTSSSPTDSIASIRKRDIRIVLIEAAPTHSAGAARARLPTPTLKLLTKLDVDVRTGARVAEVLADGVELADGRVHSGRARGLGGRRQSARCAARPRRPRDQSDQPARRARRRCRPRAIADIFAIGDCAACPWPGKHGARAAARAGRASAGVAPGQAARRGV